MAHQNNRVKIYSLYGVVIGSVISLTLALTTDIKWYLKPFITIVISLVTFWLGWISGKLQVLLSMAPDKTAIEKKFSDISSLIETENAIINLKQMAPSVFAVVGAYANKRACHLLDDGQEVFISEYLDLLENSLKQSDYKIFATSVVIHKFCYQIWQFIM